MSFTLVRWQIDNKKYLISKWTLRSHYQVMIFIVVFYAVLCGILVTAIDKRWLIWASGRYCHVGMCKH